MKTFLRFAVLSGAVFLVSVMISYGRSMAGGPGGHGFFTSDSEAGASGMSVDDPWSPGDLIQPAELARLLSTSRKPAILQVGIVHLYKISRIPGSKYAGPANDAAGLAELKKQAQSLDRNGEVVCYCGCCPWANCPNTRPAYQTLREMGFKRIKMLLLEHSFGEDWVTKGYPVEKGS